MIMYPTGHARSTRGDLGELLEHKFRKLAGPAVEDVDALDARFRNFERKSATEIRDLYDFEIRFESPRQ